jgi:hypothetical protein
MRLGAVMAIIIVSIVIIAFGACGGAGRLFKQYEYEEEMYLSLDGSATLFVNSSIPALAVLRGAGFDPRPNSRLDLDAVRQYYSSPVTRVTRVTSSRRNNRRFAHIRIDVDDVRKLGAAGPFAWSGYQLRRDGELVIYQQQVGAAAGRTLDDFHWDGNELVAFRLHLPSEIVYEDSPGAVQRGNILEWEQTLAERARSVPLTMEVRMTGQSILYRTVLLFAATAAAVAAMFVGLIIWIVKRGGRRT